MQGNDQLASLFGLQAGSALPIGGQQPLTTAPTLGQLQNLTSGESDELDAITEILFGQRLSEVERTSRALAPPAAGRPIGIIRR